MTIFPKGKLADFFYFYDPSNENHVAAVTQLQDEIEDADESLLTDLAPWVQLYRTPIKKDLPVEEPDNSWEGLFLAAERGGAKFPELLAAQWALESGFGKYPSGINNFFGIKGTGRNVASTCTEKTTQEWVNGEFITIRDWFRNFASIQECVDYLITRWYKDYKGYKGINRASTREEAARLLKVEGYATDPIYAEKLISLMDQYAGEQDG